MVKLKKIEAALAEKNYVHADYLTKQWYEDRGISFRGACPDGVINYIEQVEAQLDNTNRAIRNIFTLARRMKRKGDTSENLEHILRFCREGGAKENILRDAQAKPITWTTVKPTTPGWYWFKDDMATSIIELNKDTVWLVNTFKTESQWSSEPIAEPEEAS